VPYTLLAAGFLFLIFNIFTMYLLYNYSNDIVGCFNGNESELQKFLEKHEYGSAVKEWRYIRINDIDPYF